MPFLHSSTPCSVSDKHQQSLQIAIALATNAAVPTPETKCGSSFESDLLWCRSPRLNKASLLSVRRCQLSHRNLGSDSETPTASATLRSTMVAGSKAA